jgi:hypothetical protein
VKNRTNKNKQKQTKTNKNKQKTKNKKYKTLRNPVRNFNLLESKSHGTHKFEVKIKFFVIFTVEVTAQFGAIKELRAAAKIMKFSKMLILK